MNEEFEAIVGPLYDEFPWGDLLEAQTPESGQGDRVRQAAYEAVDRLYDLAHEAQEVADDLEDLLDEGPET